uniref:Uncharacterized protein n=1 Tax=Sus scrofa TaxID=9823 RepID=A0A8D1K0T1_PIG
AGGGGLPSYVIIPAPKQEVTTILARAGRCFFSGSGIGGGGGGGGVLSQMGDEKDSWKVKTLDEILQEKKRRKEQEEKAEIKRLKNVSYVF